MGIQKGAGQALRRRSHAALQYSALVSVPEPRLYAFEVSLAWPHRDAEYRVSLFSKLKSKDWPNPSSLLGTLAEVLHFLHTSRALQAVALDLNEDNRRLTAAKASLEHDLNSAKSAATAAEAHARLAEEKASQFRDAVHERDKTIAVLRAEDEYAKLTCQIQGLKDENARLASDLAAAVTALGEATSAAVAQADQIESLKSDAIHRETKARQAYENSLKFFEEDCKGKLEALDVRYMEVEQELLDERLLCSRLKSLFEEGAMNANREVNALSEAVTTADNVLASLTDALDLYLNSKKEALQSVDSIFQKKATRFANAKYAEQGARKLQVGRPFDVFHPIHSFLGRPELFPSAGCDRTVEDKMRAEFDSHDPVVSRKYGGIESTLSLEWEFATAPRDAFAYPGQELKVDPTSGQPFAVRRSLQVESFMKHEMAAKSKLSRSEVIALRLYTGIAHGAINDELLQTLKEHQDAVRPYSGPPPPLHRSFAWPRPRFLVTITVLNSAITKVRKVSESRFTRYMSPVIVVCARKFCRRVF